MLGVTQEARVRDLTPPLPCVAFSQLPNLAGLFPHHRLMWELNEIIQETRLSWGRCSCPSPNLCYHLMVAVPLATRQHEDFGSQGFAAQARHDCLPNASRITATFYPPRFLGSREGNSPFFHFSNEKTSQMGLNTESSTSQLPLLVLPSPAARVDVPASRILHCPWGRGNTQPPRNGNHFLVAPEFILGAWGFLARGLCLKEGYHVLPSCTFMASGNFHSKQRITINCVKAAKRDLWMFSENLWI